MSFFVEIINIRKIMKIIIYPRFFNLSTDLSNKKWLKTLILSLIHRKNVDNSVDKVENFFGLLRLHNYTFSSNFFIMSGPFSTKIPVLSAVASLKLETVPISLRLS